MKFIGRNQADFDTYYESELCQKHYDLHAAADYNDVKLPEEFDVVAEVLSEHHDEGEYYWLIQDRKTRAYQVVTGSHDYTGWDCQSGASISEPFGSLAQLPLFVPQYDNQMRPVRDMIAAQAVKP
jgi:hypothetical protein